MDTTSERTIKTIRMNEGMYHQARVAAVMSRRGLGEWLEEAIREKLERDRTLASLALEGEGRPQGQHAASTGSRKGRALR